MGFEPTTYALRKQPVARTKCFKIRVFRNYLADRCKSVAQNFSASLFQTLLRPVQSLQMNGNCKLVPLQESESLIELR